MNKLKLILILLACSVSVFSQTTIFDMQVDKGEVLYRDVVRVNSWIVGLGSPISQKDANRLPYYFCLSNKNAAGHFLKVEAKHGNELTSNHPISTYIVNKNDKFNASKWSKKLLNVCKWELFADFSGKNLIEERAYENGEKSALVYIMNVLKIDSIHTRLTYMDDSCRIVNVDNSEGNNIGNSILITYDKNRCDSIIDYFDIEGYRHTNVHGVEQLRIINDKKLRPILITSHNCFGDRIKNSLGVCGIRRYYEDPVNVISDFYVDENFREIRLKSNNVDDKYTFERCDFFKDEFGRVYKFTIFTIDGDKSTTLGGIHRMYSSYRDDGSKKWENYYDLNGNKINKIN